MLTLGIDEAGRGAVLGPLVIAGLLAGPDDERYFNDIGVQDSKAFGSSKTGKIRRQRLATQIIAQLETNSNTKHNVQNYCVINMDPPVVDHWVNNFSLNKLEQTGAKTIIEKLIGLSDKTRSKSTQTISNIRNFTTNTNPISDIRIMLDGETIFNPVAQLFPNATAINHGDQTEVSIAAASILAKVARDKAIDDIFKRPELSQVPFPIRGGGYPNAATAKLLAYLADTTSDLSPWLRKSWNWPPVQKLIAKNTLKVANL